MGLYRLLLLVYVYVQLTNILSTQCRTIEIGSNMTCSYYSFASNWQM
jgi:hypothetical protein